MYPHGIERRRHCGWVEGRDHASGPHHGRHDPPPGRPRNAREWVSSGSHEQEITDGELINEHYSAPPQVLQATEMWVFCVFSSDLPTNQQYTLFY